MIKNFPEDILVQISCAFNLFDTDKDGFLKPKDFLKVLDQVGIKLNEANMKEMMNSLSSNENGNNISIKDFVAFVNSRMKNVESEEEILEMFKIFDKKGSGKVSIGDIRSVLEDIDEPVSQQELEDLMITWDKNKDGYLDFAEFKEMMESK
jgi:calmodulin